jgi:hypothetical protein
MKNQSALSLLALAAMIAATPARANFTYDEARDGDLSNDRLNPNLLIAGQGVNTLTGTTATFPAPAGRDFDYFNVTIPDGLQFGSIDLTEYSGGDLTVIGMVAGTPFTVPPTDPANTIPPRLLGWVHISTGLIGRDLFPTMAAQTVPAPVIGFAAPLPSGSYSFWIQETSANPVNYSLSFNVSAIPEPSSLAMLGLGGLLFPYFIRRRRKPASRLQAPALAV